MTVCCKTSPTSTIAVLDASEIKTNVSAPTPPLTHPASPLEPLTVSEISTAAAIVKNEIAKASEDLHGIRFEMIELNEPPKEHVRSGYEEIDRQAIVSVYQLGRIGVSEYVVSLTTKSTISMEHTEWARPMIQLEEEGQIEDTVKSDPDFLKACERRGIDADSVCVDTWSAGSGIGGPEEEGKRISHTFCWLKSNEFDNMYAHPIEGLNAIVDINAMKVLRVNDVGDIPVPKTDCNFEAEFQETEREDLKPINVVQPEGVSFSLEGHTLKWHDWSLVIGFNAREGLTLHDIRYDGRPILYRASIAEMVVPYGSPGGSHHRKNVFDIGEYGLGKLANSLELGCDCLGSIHYLDGVISDMQGEPRIIKNAICLHEEDAGILWKHTDHRTLHTEVRRNRRFVLSFISTVGNYDYGSYWYLYMDGMIEFEVKATGIINTAACNPYEGGKYGTEVMPGVLGQIHQHHFCARLDLAVDGDSNTVSECDTVVAPESENPYGNAFYVQETPIATEGGRMQNSDTQRFWKFSSNEAKNHMGKPTSYKLEPSHSVTAFNRPDSASGKRMPFVYKHLWVTPYAANERYPAGHFVNQSDGSDGLHVWTEKKRSVESKDIVAWHVFGLHHPTRMEDFPVQPVVTTGFKLMPSGFFDRNPCLDLPADKNKASCKAL